MAEPKYGVVPELKTIVIARRTDGRQLTAKKRRWNQHALAQFRISAADISKSKLELFIHAERFKMMVQITQGHA